MALCKDGDSSDFVHEVQHEGGPHRTGALHDSTRLQPTSMLSHFPGLCSNAEPVGILSLLAELWRSTARSPREALREVERMRLQRAA